MKESVLNLEFDKTTKESMRKAIDWEKLPSKTWFFLAGCHEAGMGPVDAEIIVFPYLCKIVIGARREGSVI